MKLFDTTLARLERSLDVRLARHNVLSANVANVDTPGYTAKDVDFQAAMAAADKTAGSAESMTLATPEGGTSIASAGGSIASKSAEIPLVDAAGSAPSMDGNKVDLDRTMVALAENSMQYGASARAAGKKLAILRYVSSDGNG
jgi:flagellar basal-body rod protein FlgB